nr:class I SAM-dependent methyltransferase [Thomasclavelia saccharogumia]
MDVGCGTCKMAEVALEQCNVGKMICTDNSSAMLEVARQKISSSYVWKCYRVAKNVGL